MVDQLLNGLFGGTKDDDSRRQAQDLQDFAGRYERGAPHEGYSDHEAIQNFRNVAGRLSPQQFEDAASDAFARMSPDERRQLRREMRQRRQAAGRHDVDDDDDDDDPRRLARQASRIQHEDQGGGGLLGMLGIGGNNAAEAQSRRRAEPEDQGGSILDNPLTKVALAGIAAMAVKKMSEGHNDPNSR